MTEIVALAGQAIAIIMDAVANRNADIEASRARFVAAAHELFNALRTLRESERADHDAAIGEHLRAMVDAAPDADV